MSPREVVFVSPQQMQKKKEQDNLAKSSFGHWQKGEFGHLKLKDAPMPVRHPDFFLSKIQLPNSHQPPHLTSHFPHVLRGMWGSG